MEGILVGLIWLVIIVGGGLGLAAGIQLVRSPYRHR